MQATERRKALAEFLRTRRAKVLPEQVGLSAGSRRRTPGLRREEVAQLAHIGITWYTWLEQERDIRVSPEVLNSIASALLLTANERNHLFLLADQPLPYLIPPFEETITASLRSFIDALDMPCYVIGRRWDRIAWNTLAGAVFDLDALSLRERNAVWHVLTDPNERTFLQGWQEKAQGIVAQFRSDYGRYLGDPWFEELISDLNEVSQEFREWWPRYDLLVSGSTDGRKELNHPLVGSLVFDHVTLQVPKTPDLKVMILTPLSEDDTISKLRRLVAMSHARNGSKPSP